MDKKDIVFGVRAIIESLEAGKTLDKIYIKRDSSSELIKELLEKANHYSVPVFRVPIEKLNRITRKNHQGAIALLSPATYYRLDDLIPALYEEGKTPLGVILDGITDARNFGSIARTCECAGVDFIVIAERGSVSVTSDAVKASAGALFHIPVCRERDLKTASTKLKYNGYKLIGASEKASVDFTMTDYTAPTCIIMGAEDKGLSIEMLKECDQLVAIPILGKIGSLNVGVAAGIIIYAAVEQRLETKG